MISKIKVQVIYHSLEDYSPHVNIARQKLQYAKKFVILGPKRLEFQQIYVQIPEVSLKIKTLTSPYALLLVILKSCSVPERLPKVIY